MKKKSNPAFCYPAFTLPSVLPGRSSCCGKKRTETVVGDLTAYPSSVYDPYRNSGAHRLDYKNFYNQLLLFFKVVFGLSPGGAYVFLLGLLTGYPMGAKLTADLYYAGKISRQEAEYLLTFCNNPSPAFLITYVGHICLEGKLHIGFLVGILFLSDMICMCFFRFTLL